MSDPTSPASEPEPTAEPPLALPVPDAPARAATPPARGTRPWGKPWVKPPWGKRDDPAAVASWTELVLVAINVVIFAIMVAKGIHWWSPNHGALIARTPRTLALPAHG